MALIECTECGKSFSDKAAACPVCGCPTVEITNQESLDIPSVEDPNETDPPVEDAPSAPTFGGIVSNIQSSVVSSIKDKAAIKKVGPVQVDTQKRLFRISGSVAVNGKKDGLMKTMFKGTMAVGTMGMSVAAGKLMGGKKKVGSKEWFEFDDLVGYELMQDDSVVVSGGVGQALIGGALFGGFGAVAGAVSGKRTSKKKIESLYLKITMNTFDMPCVMLPLITKPTKIDSKEYKNAFNQAHEILSMLDVITHNK